MNPRTVCFCQAIFSMISASVAPLFRWSMATTWAVLLPWRVPLAFDSPLGGFFDRVALVADLASFGATSGDCTANGGFGFSRSGGGRLGCWDLNQRGISVDRAHSWLRSRGSRGPFSEALDGLPDALGGDLPVRKL